MNQRAEGWDAQLNAPLVSHLVSRRGDRVLMGAGSGELRLYDRRGKLIWEYSLGARIESLIAGERDEIYAAGTWAGRVRVFSGEGFLWETSLSSVISALAFNPRGDLLAAGTWRGDLAVFSGGVEVYRHQLPEAVQALAFSPVDDLLVCALADGTLCAFTAAGSAVWSQGAGARLRAFAVQAREVLLVTDREGLRCALQTGARLDSRPAEGTIRLAAASTDCEWVAWIEDQSTIVFWHPSMRQGWRHALRDIPDAIQVAGPRTGPFCMLALPDGRLLAMNRFQRTLESRLGARVQSLSFARSGSQLSFVTFDGSGAGFRELRELVDWLPIPDLTLSVGGVLTMGQLGTVSVRITNTGGRDAEDVQLTLDGGFIRESVSCTVPRVAAGDEALVVKAVEPLKPGQIPITVVAQFCDELGKPFERRYDVFISVNREASS